MEHYFGYKDLGNMETAFMSSTEQIQKINQAIIFDDLKSPDLGTKSVELSQIFPKG